MRRGAVHSIDLEPAAPPEMGKTRPGIIVSSTAHNERLDSVVVVPLSPRAPEIWPLRLRINLERAKSSFAIIPAIRQVSKSRLRELIGPVSSNDMSRIDEALTLYLGD